MFSMSRRIYYHQYERLIVGRDSPLLENTGIRETVLRQIAAFLPMFQSLRRTLTEYDAP